ncbi:hypothetical protein SUGI_1025560 [Cryptomeria japonica]|uniref:zinc finger protein VAR3, chloroplastic n=1 Tax=Cryptomeria japonica TaxID=3369 RepID=UPI002414930B|nr:zinc finger protein VAR3, chloroplastic [Cryptomeria japonica]GLJ48604.1 hypothetical protein SUGI_1025560 [Cryptomeria japonica]
MGFARFPFLLSGIISLTSRFHTSGPFLSLYHTTCLPCYRLNQFEGLGPRLSSVLNKIDKSERNDLEIGTATGSTGSTECAQSVKQENDKKGVLRREVEVYHPWAEWIDLVDRLAEGNYFNAAEGDDNEDDVVDDVPDGSEEDKRVLKALRSACRRFGHERFDIFRSLSRRDIQVIVGSGCPSLDGKVVNSGKRLRAYVNLNEGDVCSACTLRASCERAYVMPRREDTARTVDVMRILMTCAYHPLIGPSKHKIQMRKNVKASARKLLKQVVELSATPLDPNLPKPTFVGPPPKVKKSQPFPRKKLGRDDIAKMRGDWQCPRCDFMNFAKNNECLQCDEIRPKPKLHQGEWECPGCGYVNYKKNLACHRCECNHPRGGYSNSSTESTQQFTLREWKWKKPVD